MRQLESIIMRCAVTMFAVVLVITIIAWLLGPFAFVACNVIVKPFNQKVDCWNTPITGRTR